MRRPTLQRSNQAAQRAMLGVAFTRAPAPEMLTSLQALVLTAYFSLTALSFWHLHRGSFPDTNGGIGSLVYFGEIAKLQPADYVERFGNQSEADFSDALLHQAWRNSCILSSKFNSLKKAYLWMLASVAPWALALLTFPPEVRA